ncbi:MAG: tetratricopeptide repeat protein [Deltaproteobacteria bacterium]|nr:tetratricopeptide repeat protein [Deltaproteobacteria bacterium]
MAKGKITVRRELKQPDGFMKTVNGVVEYVKFHRRKAIAAGIVVLALIIGFSVVQAYIYHQNRQASRVLGESLAAMGEMDDAAQVKAGLAKLEDGFNAFHFAASYPLACFLRGNDHYFLGNFDQSRQSYEEAVAKTDDYVADLCRLGIAYDYFAAKKFDQCAAMLEKMRGDNPKAGEEVYLLLGMSYERLRRNQEAIAVYENMVQFVPDSRFRGWVEGRLAHLKLLQG